MRKIISVVVSLVLVLTVLVGCSANQMPTEKPKDFAFILKYGVGAKNVLNTKDGTFTKDMISSGTKTTDLKLSDDELVTVYNDLRKINIMDYPEVFKPDRFVITQRSVSPNLTYELTIVYSGKQKTVFWNDESLSEESEAKLLRGMIDRVRSIIESKDEYKKLPEPQGGYI